MYAVAWLVTVDVLSDTSDAMSMSGVWFTTGFGTLTT